MHLQSLFKLILALVLGGLLLVACGGDAPADNPTAESQNVDPEPTTEFLATDAPTEVPTLTPSPVLPPPTAIPLDVQLSDLPAGQYNLSMTGALNSDIGFTSPDEGLTGATYDVASNGTNLDGPFEFALWTDILTDGTTEDTTARVLFTIPASIEAGTYDVVARDALTSSDAVGVEVVTGQITQRFASNAAGTITIVSNGGAGGVFSGEFEVSVGDDAGNTILANGRASAIPFTAEEAAELTVSGAIELMPLPENLAFTLARDGNTTTGNDWRLDVAVANSDTNPHIISHRIYMTPNIPLGTYEIQSRQSPNDARPNDVDVTAFVEVFNTEEGTRVEATDISGTLEVVNIRDKFTATFTLTYSIVEGETITAEGGAFYMFKPAD